MGGKPSNFNQMNAMATDRKDRVNDERIRTQSKHHVGHSAEGDESLIPHSPENPEQAELRAMHHEKNEE